MSYAMENGLIEHTFASRSKVARSADAVVCIANRYTRSVVGTIRRLARGDFCTNVLGGFQRIGGNV